MVREGGREREGRDGGRGEREGASCKVEMRKTDGLGKKMCSEIHNL